MGRLKDAKYVDPQQVYQYLIQEKGLTENHAMGILANIQAESGFNAAAIGDQGSSGGLFQHHSTRFSGLKNYAAGDWTNWQKQVDFALSENASKKYLGKTFKSPEEASKWWTVNWEVPSDKEKKSVERLSHLSKFKDFTNYTPTEISRTTNKTPTPAKTGSNVGILISDGDVELTHVDSEAFAKELEKAEITQSKTEESPERQKIDQMMTEREEFLSMIQQQAKPQYFKPGETSEAGIPINEIEIPVSEMSELPSLFSTGNVTETNEI